MQSADLAWLVAGALGLLLVVQTVRLLARTRWRSYRISRRGRRAARLEHAAEGVLERAGYRIEAVQPAMTWRVRVDGEERPFDLRADLLVSKNARQYVAEVKSGGAAPRLRTAATRRQLLEYVVAYRADGVLLVDMEERKVHEVVFDV